MAKDFDHYEGEDPLVVDPLPNDWEAAERELPRRFEARRASEARSEDKLVLA